MGSPMPGSKKVVLAPTPPKKVTPNKLIVDPQGGLQTNKLIVDPQGGLQPNKLRVDPRSTKPILRVNRKNAPKVNKAASKMFFPAPTAYTPIKNTMQVNKLYKSY